MRFLHFLRDVWQVAPAETLTKLFCTMFGAPEAPFSGSETLKDLLKDFQPLIEILGAKLQDHLKRLVPHLLRCLTDHIVCVLCAVGGGLQSMCAVCSWFAWDGRSWLRCDVCSWRGLHTRAPGMIELIMLSMDFSVPHP